MNHLELDRAIEEIKHQHNLIDENKIIQSEFVDQRFRTIIDRYYPGTGVSVFSQNFTPHLTLYDADLLVDLVDKVVSDVCSKNLLFMTLLSKYFDGTYMSKSESFEDSYEVGVGTDGVTDITIISPIKLEKYLLE